MKLLPKALFSQLLHVFQSKNKCIGKEEESVNENSQLANAFLNGTLRFNL